MQINKRQLRVLLILLSIELIYGCAHQKAKENISRGLIKDIYGAVNERNWEKARTYFHDNFTDHRYPPGPGNNAEAVIKTVQEFVEKNPGTTFTVLQELADGNLIAGRIQFTTFGPAGDSTTYCNYDFYSIKDGKLLEMWFSTSRVPVFTTP